jgi:hypothetical protein
VLQPNYRTLQHNRIEERPVLVIASELGVSERCVCLEDGSAGSYFRRLPGMNPLMDSRQSVPGEESAQGFYCRGKNHFEQKHAKLTKLRLKARVAGRLPAKPRSRQEENTDTGNSAPVVAQHETHPVRHLRLGVVR